MKPTLGLILVSLVLLGSVIAAYYYLRPTTTYRPNPALYPPLSGSMPFSIVGELEVYKNGVLVHSGPDILTNNFYNWLHDILIGAFLLDGGSGFSCPTPAWAANAGTQFKDVNGNPQCSWAKAGYSAAYVKIHFGTGTSIPQRTDYALASEVASAAATATFGAPSSGSQIANLTFTASYTASSSITISEVGLSGMWFATGTGCPCYIYMAHDTIPSQSLNAGDVLTVVYRLIAPVNYEVVDQFTPLNGGTAFLGLIAQCLTRSTSISGLPASATFGSYCLTSGLGGANIVFISPDGKTQTNNQGLLANTAGPPKITIVGYAPQTLTIGAVSYRITVGSQLYEVITFYLSPSRSLVQGQAAGLQFSGP